MKLKFAIIPLLLVCLAIGIYLVFNTGRRAVERLVPSANENTQPLNPPRFLDDPNQSVRPAIFRSVTERGGQILLRGTAQPEVVVSILGNGERRQQIRADKDGIWSAEIDVSNDPSLIISLTSFLDETSQVNGDELLLRITNPRDAVSDEASDEGEEVLDNTAPLILLTAPGGPSRVIRTPFGSLPSQGPLTLGPIEYDDLGGVIFSGFATQVGRLRIFGDEELIGETRVGANGRWYLIAAETLPLDPYALRVQLQETNGTETNINVNFKRIAPEDRSELSPYVVYDDAVWHIRRDLSGGGVQYTAVMSQGSIVEPKADKDN